MSNNTGDEARVPEGDARNSSTAVGEDKDILLSYKISSLHAGILFIPRLGFAAPCSSFNTFIQVSMGPSPSVKF